jgi:NAD(P)H-hydrate epimerase
MNAQIPSLSTEQMIEVDRAMIEDYHIELIQMMENAGRNLAHLARVRFLGGDTNGKMVVVLAGTGGNGGGALVAARRLHTWGARVSVFVTLPPERLSSIPGHQYDILNRMGVPVAFADAAVADLTHVTGEDLIIDGIIGYNLSGPPRGTAAQFIAWANAQPGPVLALDVPSGVDTTTGIAYTPAIRATATLTLALPKQGLRKPEVEQLVGELYLADISVPPSLYTGPKLGLAIGPIFARDDIVRLS